MRRANRIAWWCATLILPAVLALPLTAQTPRAPYRDARLPVAERVRDLLGRMTLEEQFWQLFMVPGDLDDPANDYSHGIFGLQVPPGAPAGARARAQRI